MKWITENKKIAGLGFVIFFCSLIFIYGIVAVNSNKIYRGVRVGEVDLSGLTIKQGEKAVGDYVRNKKEDEIRLKSDLTSYTYTFGELGFSAEAEEIVERAYQVGRSRQGIKKILSPIKLLFVPEIIKLNSEYDQVQMARVIKELEEKIDRESENARLAKDDQGKIVHLAGRQGAKLDIKKTKEIFSNLTGSEDAIELPIKKIDPKIKKEDLAFINGVLGTFSTDYSQSEDNRKDNIALGSEYFNEVLLEPGQEMSFLKTINGINTKNGFKVSGVIKDGKFDRGVGGGICQVSTTMYNALVRADVEIIQRHNHSRPIGYVPRGTDAAVVEGYKDLVFKNTYKSPIYLVAKADGYEMEFIVYGNIEEKPYDIELVPESLGSIYPSVKKKYSSSLYEGVEKIEDQGAKGYSYQTWKVKRKDGQEIERTLLNKSYYIPRQKVVLVGTKEKPVQKIVSSDTNESEGDS